MISDSHKPTPAPWARAVDFAARAHQHQTRKDGVTPQMAHPTRVALVLQTVFECTDAAALTAALLHDVIEDCDVDYEAVAADFGAEIADCVAALSKNALLPHDAREADYDQRLAEAGWRARLIKLADVYDNLSDTVKHPRYPDPVNSRIDKARRALALAEDDPQAEKARKAVRELIHQFQAALGQIA